MNGFNPAMLILARESRGLTQAEVALRSGCSQGALSKAENGQVEPAEEVARGLSHTLGVPVDFFYQPLRYKNLPLTFFRKRLRVSPSLVKAITAKINIVRLHVERLARSAELPKLRIRSMDLEEFGGDPQRVAREVRLALNLPPGPIANLTRTLEDAGILIVNCDFGTNQIDGLSIYEPDDTLPPIILINPFSPGDRVRYTLAHELMHIILHHHLAVPGPDVEPQANGGASELLLPASEVRGFLSGLTIQKLASLKTYWKVSMQALVMRAAELGKISDRQKRSLFVRMNKYGWRTQEPVIIPREEPTLIGELIDFHLTDLGYTEEELSQALVCNVGEFREIYRGATKLPNLRVVKAAPVRPLAGTRR